MKLLLLMIGRLSRDFEVCLSWDFPFSLSLTNAARCGGDVENWWCYIVKPLSKVWYRLTTAPDTSN